MPFSHAYSVLDARELSDGTQLLHVRNPWGSERYHGPFSDKSKLWKDFSEFKDVVDKDDGLWWIDAQTFYESMDYSTGSPKIDDDKRTYYARFDI